LKTSEYWKDSLCAVVHLVIHNTEMSCVKPFLYISRWLFEPG